MYKVLIVDDEMLARVGIKSLIPWEEHGFTVVGEAENGKQAYDFYMNNHVDIIITDIKMPVLNGIELIRKIKEHNSQTKFIVLSSFNDFEYVKEALKSGASDYLIKLEVQPGQLLEQLKKITITLKSEKSVKSQPERKRNDTKEKTHLKDKFFKDLLYGWIRKDYEYKKRLDELNLNLPDGKVVCLMFYTDSMDIYERYKDEEIHVLNYAILNMLNEIVSEYKFTFALSTKTKEFVVIQYSEEEMTEEESIERADHLAHTIKNAIKQYLNFSVSISVSHPVNTCDQIHAAYKQVHDIHKYQMSLNEEDIMHHSEFCKLNMVTHAINLNEELELLGDSIKLHENANVSKALTTIRTKVEETEAVSMEILKGYCSTIIYLISYRKGKVASDWMAQQLKWIDKMAGKSDFLKWLTYIYKDWNKEQKELNENSRIISSAQRYIQANYATDITLESVANYLNLSPSYLSNLFKKETGKKFIDYLTKIRINQSKIYLREHDYKIYEVGQMVGYDNEYYFSRVFKKNTGVSPRRYRSKPQE
ncbi:response regulator transcription factor [Paraliobacillus salinarum]|uniref:response regulator transcription factor n=1 Tax=Paraliobacillus salinarum TaxID=1158996 RepID=UPI0015F572C4|nr:response regulator [Paraliobacillus salinarum]